MRQLNSAAVLVLGAVMLAACGSDEDAGAGAVTGGSAGSDVDSGTGGSEPGTGGSSGSGGAQTGGSGGGETGGSRGGETGGSAGEATGGSAGDAGAGGSADGGGGGAGGASPGCAAQAHTGTYQMTISSVSGRCVSLSSGATQFVAFGYDLTPGYDCYASEEWSPDECTLSRGYSCCNDAYMTCYGWGATSRALNDSGSLLEGTITATEMVDRTRCPGSFTFVAERPVAGAAFCRESCVAGEYCEAVVRYAPEGTSTADPACRAFPSACPASDPAGMPSCECVFGEVAGASNCVIDSEDGVEMMFVLLPDQYDCPELAPAPPPGRDLMVVAVATVYPAYSFTLRNVSDAPISTGELFVINQYEADGYAPLYDVTLQPGQEQIFTLWELPLDEHYLVIYRGLRGPGDLGGTGADNRMVAYLQWAPDGNAPWVDVAVDAGLWSDPADGVATRFDEDGAHAYRYLVAVGDVRTGAGFEPVNVAQCLP